MVHELKTWPEFFTPIMFGNKSFELRKDDRGFKFGDYIVLREYDPKKEEYTGRSLMRQINYILYPSVHFDGFQDDICIMSLGMV